ncbi:hypothetical protein QFC19_002518 [Naganishia cerealis]|uniref:Uncharacterized protein n=1 Tax=Naganishia cerealis TaxID=610337 RepID=A0ACC2WAY1_9TREE|nr:hypothetical protein QFC19_002518 [Naganishia cerealis]
MPTTSASRSTSRLTAFSLLALSSASLTQAINVESRWGQKAAYVPSQQSIYFIGGEVSSWNGSITAPGVPSITNEILVLNLTTDNPSFSTGISTDLPPTAFHTVTYAEKTHQLVSVGGLTSHCSGDTIAHTFDLDGANSWRSIGVQNLARRRGMGSGYSVKDEQVLVVGGLADEYVCSSSTYSYPAYDLIPVPMSSATSVQTSALSYAALNSNPQLGVIDFSLTRLSNDSFVLAGGADSSGSLVSFDNVGVWDAEGGWKVAQTSGQTPAPRVGHNMLAHPTLDLLVLHGGATNTANLSSTASTTLAFLNLTTMTWTQPANLQPPTSFARAWHSSIMVDSGVLVTAFGLSAVGTPRNDIVYLDMRNDDVSKWTWKAVWSASMLNATIPSSSGNILPTSGSSNNGSPGHDGKTLKSILIPVLIVIALGIPLAVWLLRRHVRNVRHRRMAQHFEMDPEEDHRNGSILATSALGQFLASKFKSADSARRPSLPKPFGGVRINEKGEVVNNNDSMVVSHLKGIFKRFSYSSFKSFDTMESTAQDKEMSEIRAGVAAITTGNNGQMTEKAHQWEEIDFGLGKVDESRRNSAIPVRNSASFDEPRQSDNETRSISLPEVKFEGPFGDEFQVQESNVPANDARLLPPALVILPPSEPATPSIDSNGNSADFVFTGVPAFVESPIDTLDSPMKLEREAVVNVMKDEWESLADSLVAHPIFGSSTPTTDFTRTPHDESSLSTENPMTALPPLAFQQRRASGSGKSGNSKYSGLGVSPFSTPTFRSARNPSVAALPVSGTTSRSVSQPIGLPGRDLISPLSSGRRSGDFGDFRADAKAKAANRVSASGIYDKFRSPYIEALKPRPVSSYGPEGSSPLPSSSAALTKRYSTPPLFPPPNSPPPEAPFGHTPLATQYARDGIERYPSKRSSGESKLRVVNMTPDMANGQNEWGL